MKGIIIYFADIHILIKELNDAQIGRLFLTMIEYAETKNIPDIDDILVRAVFWQAKSFIDRDSAKYEEISKKRSEAGKKHSGNQYTRSNDNGTLVPFVPTKWNKMEQMEQITNNKYQITNNNIDNINSTVHSGECKTPTLEEIKSYIKEKKYSVDALAFFAYYEANGWMIGKRRMVKWKAAVTSWQKKEERSCSPVRKGCADANRIYTYQEVANMVQNSLYTFDDFEIVNKEKGLRKLKL